MEKVISANNYHQNMDADCIINPAFQQKNSKSLQKENTETFDFFYLFMYLPSLSVTAH